MSSMDNDIGDMVTDLLTAAGDAYTYRNGAGGATATVTAVKSSPPSFQIDNGNGLLIEVRPVEFKMLTSALPYGNPVKGQRLERGGSVWEIQPTTSEKCFYQQSTQMTRIHSKLISGTG